MKNPVITKIWNQISAVCICLVILVCSAQGQIAVGGTYTLTQTAIAGGGASGTGAGVAGNYSLEGTIGQNAAGTKQQNVPYSFQSGFWTAQESEPTAANVAVSGRVMTPNGRGIRNVRVTLTGTNGAVQTVLTSTFGYFRFAGVAAGDTSVFSVYAKRFTFSQPVQVHSILEDTDDIFFIADFQ